MVNLHVSIGDMVLICSSACLSDLGQAIFYTTTCLLPFLSDDILSTLPYTMISTLATFPPFLHKDIIEYLSTSFLPMAICEYTNCICGNISVLCASSRAHGWFDYKQALINAPLCDNRALGSKKMIYVLQWVRLEERAAFQHMSICPPPPC